MSQATGSFMRSSILTFVCILLAALSGLCQQAPSPAPASASPDSTEPVSPSAAVPASHPSPAPKSKKAVYTGPTEVVVLPPTPMLDEEGRQRLDPDGKPMFNPALAQQRDKKGHPVFDAAGKPVMQTDHDLGYDEKGKKIKGKKEKPPKMVPLTIASGTFTVDGVIGKAALNYDIPDLKFLYLYAPGIGIAVVSNQPFAGATEQKLAFNRNSLDVTVEGHALEVASDKPLLGKKKKPESAFVLLDRNFTLPSRFPVVGYGQTLKSPYAWPGSKQNAHVARIVEPPPLPIDLKPIQLQKPCPSGQMRKPGPVPLPGQPAVDQPCVAITAVQSQGLSAKSVTSPSPAGPKQ
jgi:hypothetical protein